MEPEKNPPKRETEFEGPLWKHPYLIYVWMTALLFGLILLAAWLAWTNGWLPKR